jgi:RNA polymerase II subunit A-like phosphatase
LSLIVDLDQTIIHTTVDPTVGEWMAEIERDEEEEVAPPTLSTDAEGSGKGKETEREEGKVETTTPPGSPRPAKRKREPNPNAEALKDVARFTLADDPAPGQGRRKVPERYYYTKPRSVYLPSRCKY